MKASLAWFAVMLGTATVACSAERTDPGADSADLTRQDPAAASGGDAREEFQCDLTDGTYLRVKPAFSEIHREDVDMGKWSTQDGLSFERTSTSLLIRDDEGAAVGSIDNHGKYASGDGAVTGECQTIEVKDVAPTSAPFSVDDGTLRYDCTLGNVSLMVRPAFGEIDEIHHVGGIIYWRDGLSFSLKSLETSPPKNQIRVGDEDASVATIIEDDHGVSITMGELSGTCTKQQHTKR